MILLKRSNFGRTTKTKHAKSGVCSRIINFRKQYFYIDIGVKISALPILSVSARISRILGTTDSRLFGFWKFWRGGVEVSPTCVHSERQRRGANAGEEAPEEVGGVLRGEGSRSATLELTRGQIENYVEGTQNSLRKIPMNAQKSEAAFVQHN